MLIFTKKTSIFILVYNFKIETLKKNRNILTKQTKLTLFETGCALLAIFLISVRLFYIFSYNTNLEGVEFALVHFIQLICLKGSLYTDAAQFPFLLVVHAPMYYYLMAAIMKLFSVNVVENVHTMYIIGRSISFILLFVNYFILVKIVQLFIVDFKYKIRLFLVFILFIPAHFYACRPDSFKVLFFMLFVYAIIQNYKTNKAIYAFIAFLFLLIGILFKQDIIVYGFLLYLILFIYNRKISYIISPILLIVALCSMLYSYFYFSGINLFKQLFLYNLQYDSDIRINLLLIAAQYVKTIPILIFTVLNLRSKNKLTIIIAIVSLLYFIVFSVFMLRIGSSFNYTYESVIFLLINAFIYIDEHEINLSYLRMSLYVGLLFAVNLFIFYNIILSKKEEKNYKNAYNTTISSSKKIKEIIGNAVVFIPDMKYYLFYATSTIIYGADWHYDRYCDIALNIKINPKFIHNTIVDEYDKQFENGTVQYILIENNTKSTELIKKYYTSFKLEKRVNNFLIYKFSEKVSIK